MAVEVKILVRAVADGIEYDIQVGDEVDEKKTPVLLCLAHGMVELALNRQQEVGALGHMLLTKEPKKE